MKRTCYCIAFLTLCICAYAQELRTVALTKYTQNEGLSSYYITKIIQDHFGFMWIGTQEGLNAFNGKTFQVFSKQSPPGQQIGGSFVADLALDKERNLLWILTSYGDICAMDLLTKTISTRLTTDPKGTPLSEKWIRCLHIQNDRLWIGGLNALYVYDITRKEYLNNDFTKRATFLEAREEVNISRVTSDQYNRIWIFSDGSGVTVLDKDQNPIKKFRGELFSRPGSNQKLRFWDALIRGDMLYAASSKGLLRFSCSDALPEQQPLRTNAVFTQSEVLSIAFTSASSLIFSTTDGFYSYDILSDEMISFSDEDTDDNWLTYTFQTFFDHETGKIWVGTQAGLGSFISENTAFKAFSRSRRGHARLKHIYSILPYTSNKLYCADEDGLFQVETNTKEIVKIDTGSANLMLFKDNRSNIFLSNKNGLYIVKDKTLTPAFKLFPELKPLSGDHLSCAIQYNDSIIAFASIIQKGLTIWNTVSKSITTFHNDSARNSIKGLRIINNLYKGKDENIFVITEKAILRFNPLTRKCSSHVIRDSSGSIISNCMDMCETDDSYWLGTYGMGLFETDKNFKVKQTFTVNDGLSNNCVYRVFSFDNHIISTTNNGLSVVDQKERFIRTYYPTDGLHGNAFEQFCGFQKENIVYAGGVNGFTIVDAANISLNTLPPKLYWDVVKIDARSADIDTSNLYLKTVVVPNDVLQTTVSFTALNYSDPSRVRYAYKIVDPNSEWISLGNQNFINLIGLLPGHYTLEVKAANENGIWTERPIVLDLHFQPKWYQTMVFQLIVLITGAVLIHALFSYRIRQLKKQQQIRKEIANDLHDDVGSTLNTIKLFTHLAKREPENTKYLEQIEESLQGATISLRDIIWILDDAQDTIYELAERLKKFYLPICQAHQITFESSIQSDKISRSLSKTEKKNLFLISKEAINNSVKYSNCKNIRLVIFQSKNEMNLSVIDDGDGFDTNMVTDGNGLRNMKYRANQIAYKFEISSSKGIGSKIYLSKNKP